MGSTRTAALDAETEHARFERYTAAVRGGRVADSDRIRILVQHRFSAVRSADLIVVLDGATVVEVGPHAELLACRWPVRRAPRHSGRVPLTVLPESARLATATPLVLAGALPESSAPAGVKNKAQELLERGRKSRERGDHLRRSPACRDPGPPRQPKDSGEKIEDTFSS